MFIETFESEGLAHLAYLVGDGLEAAIIDPPRDVDTLLDAARRRGVRVRYVLETHRNEDYVVGSLAVADRTGATVHHGAGLDFGYGQPTVDGDRFALGNVQLETLETPGHTPESVSFVLRDTSTGDSALAVFTGDTLFVGDVGRTDLTADDERAARQLYASLHDKLLTLGDQVIVHPAHGAGSVCGEGMANRNVSTIGYERAHNPALRLDHTTFLTEKMAERHTVPPYFAEMEVLNRDGLPRAKRGSPAEVPPLDPAGVDEALERGARAVDVRSAEAFLAASIPGSLALPLELVAAYAGWLLPPDIDLVLIADDPDQMDRARTALLRIGRDRVVGGLPSGLGAWQTSARPIQTLGVAPPFRVLATSKERPESVVDVRKPSEWISGHLPGSTHAFLGTLPRHLGDGELPTGRLTVVCGSGKRATIAASLLRAENREVEVGLGSLAALGALGQTLQPGLDARRLD